MIKLGCFGYSLGLLLLCFNCFVFLVVGSQHSFLIQRGLSAPFYLGNVPYNFASSDHPSDPDNKNFNPIKVAFFGDQGLTNNSKAVLWMIRSLGVDAVIHAGDFDYENSPSKFNHQINAILGKNYPYFAAIGNHDVQEWSGYRKKLTKRMKRTGYADRCEGEYGVKMVCRIGEVIVVLSGAGTMGENHTEFIDKALSAYPKAHFKVCVWHKVQTKYQIGDKKDEVGWGPYETCRKHGAMIVSGHNHVYARSLVMKDYENSVVESEKRFDLSLKAGQSFATVVGVGGIEVTAAKNGLEKNPWWAVTASKDNNLNSGALICTFHNKGQPNTAHCQMIDISGKIWDDYTINSKLLLDGE